MALFRNRPGILRPGMAALASKLTSDTVDAAETTSLIRPKALGETKIVAVFARDINHNGIAQEHYVRNIFKSKPSTWRMIFVRVNRYFTPELISDADLVIVHHGRSGDTFDIENEPIAEKIEAGARIWTDENAQAVVDNVINRGMGFIALHNTLYSMNPKIEELLGVAKVYHEEIQPLWTHYLNQEHPITKGIGKFFINLDEQFGAVIKSRSTTTLLETTAMHDKRRVCSGWCLERGKGRVVGLLPGHYIWAYRGVPGYQEIFWRATHWAMKQDIPPYTI